MAIIKGGDCVCPNCGEEIETDRYLDEFDCDCLVNHYVCRHCDHTWREYYKIQYDGYADNTGIYDANGRKEED